MSACVPSADPEGRLVQRRRALWARQVGLINVGMAKRFAVVRQLRLIRQPQQRPQQRLRPCLLVADRVHGNTFKQALTPTLGGLFQGAEQAAPAPHLREILFVVRLATLNARRLRRHLLLQFRTAHAPDLAVGMLWDLVLGMDGLWLSILVR
jgi:hypothetical protein